MKPLWLTLGLLAFCRVQAEPLPSPQYPEKFNLGKAVTLQEIQVRDIDVRPDGKGLPEGSGTVSQGEKIYRETCLACHGEHGKGGINDPLAGRLPNDDFPFSDAKAPKKTIGNYWSYATTLFDYIRRSMPYTTPGSLSDQQVYSVTAYLLCINGIIDHNTTLDKHSLPLIVMPSRHRFKNDNRLESNKAY